MTVKSREFVGIAEGIRSHELSAKKQIEHLQGQISELSGRKISLEGTISYLEAAIAAAYEDTDEEGYPDYSLIASLEAEKSTAEGQLSNVEQEMDTADRELESKEVELEAVEDEKARILFEIQERARKTASNIAVAGGTYGVYAGAGDALQSSFQVSLASLSQAAGILGGSVSGASCGTSGSSSSGSGGRGGRSGGDLAFGPLTAIAVGPSDGSVPLPVSKFHTDQDQRSTPGMMSGFRSSHGTTTRSGPQNYTTAQASNESALNSFIRNDTPASVTIPGANEYSSAQSSKNLEQAFVPKMSAVPTAAHRQHSFADWPDPSNYTADGRYIGSGQTWGYQPGGKDAGEYAAMTPQQQALSRYMQEHGYGKGDFSTYSMDAQWQKLHKAAYPGSGVVGSLCGSSIARQHLADYMNAHNYSQADFAVYSKDAQWQRLHQMAYPDSGIVASLNGSGLARQQLSEYMNVHNYGRDDFSVYSREPEWQRLHKCAYPENYSSTGRYCYGDVVQPQNIHCMTDIDSSVRDLPIRMNLSDSLKNSFHNGEYRTVIAQEEIKLYRVYGGGSDQRGTFLTTQAPTDRMDAKMGLALKAEWKNSRQQFCEVTIPKGTVMNIGKVAPQITASGHILPGGMDQVVVSREFSKLHPEAFGSPKDLGFKSKKDDHAFVEKVLSEYTSRSKAWEELSEHVMELTESAKAYTEVCWLPKEHELPLAMAKADMLTSALNTALISVCLVAEHAKRHIKK